MPRLVPSARISCWRPCAYVLCLLWILVPLLAYADQFTGKVVGILDGDTIRVLRGGKAVKVRLHGVDTPEKAQAFGTQACKFTGDLVFPRDVTVVVHATDRYGRLVGEVLLPGWPEPQPGAGEGWHGLVVSAVCATRYHPCAVRSRGPCCETGAVG
jgi:Staphylococcal nuclease homologue